jgi:hypothetical protein
MRKLITSFIGPNKAMPIKQGTLDHLQLAYQEAISALGESQIGSDYDPTKVYILYGCENNDTHPNYDISAGAVFYNGEVYLVDAANFVAANTAVGTITTSYYASAIADPVTFTDGVAHNVHEIKKMVIANGVSGSGTADFADWVSPEWVSTTSITGVAVVGASTGTIPSLSVTYIKKGNIVFLGYKINVNVTVAGASIQVDYPLPYTANPYIGRGSCVYGDSGGLKVAYATINGATMSLNSNGPVVGASEFSGQVFYRV